MMSESQPGSETVETMSELAAHLGELPEPSEDPTVAYIHPGKTYDVIGGGVFTITAYYPEGPADGVVEFEMADGVHAVSEHEREDGGATRAALEEYEPDESDRGVMTVAGLMSEIREISIGEQDAWSYEDAYWNRKDSDASEGSR